MLIFLNSIVWHNPAPALGWYGNWGMAATSIDKDFVHVYQDLLEKSDLYKNVNVKSKNVGF